LQGELTQVEVKNLSFRKILLAFIAWSITWTALQTAVLYFSAGFPPTLALLDSIVNNAILGLGGYAMINVMRFYQPRQSMRLAYSVGLAIMCAFAMKWISPYTVSEDPSYQEFVNKTLLLRSIFGWLMISLISASTWIYSYFTEQQELEERRHANEKLAREAELSRLRQQLQPHFLFNSLNSISALAGTRPEEARRMIQQLSDFLRGTLKKDDQQLVPFSEELAHLELYLEIEKVRFGHRMKTHLEQNEKASSCKIPSLLLQPVVENAIKFGLYDTTGDIVIRLRAEGLDNHLLVTVENPFDATTTKPRQGTGFGLNSVQRRLYLLFARHDLMTTSQDETTFTTTIKIPQST
jgi:two-component system, LytTR family, sensor kinase